MKPRTNPKGKVRFRPNAYPERVRELVQVDYAQKLSPEERRWLAHFNESEYGGNPDCLEAITGERVSVDERRRLWREIKRYVRDSASQLGRVDVVYYFRWMETSLSSVEDKMIEFIDRERAIEREVVRNLIFTISSKEWSECQSSIKAPMEKCPIT